MTDIFKERERAFENVYFSKQDAKLLEKMRQRAALQEVAEALADKLRVEDAELLQRVADLGLTRGTGAALLLAPLVQVAWAEGKVTPAERQEIFDIAASRGVVAGSPPGEKLEAWLEQRPPDSLFEAAMEVLRIAGALLTPEEREERRRTLVEACERVARVSGGGLAKLLGLSDGISGAEAAVLRAIAEKLRAEPGSSR